MKVIYSKNVIDFLADLIEILYNQDYLGFKDSAKKYVAELITEIDSTITTKHKRIAPEHFDRYGKNMYYVSYRRNKNTIWYVFFNYTENIYYVRYIANNHAVAQYI
ncbi:MAG: hypothetical protein ACLVKO_01515 [Dysgonomonas sp.]